MASQDQKWRSKTVLITGASGRLGCLMAKSLKEQGCMVIGTYVNRVCNDENVDHWFQLDLLSNSSIKDFCGQVSNSKIHIDIVVHNARSTQSLSVDQKGWPDCMDFTNEFEMAVTGPYKLTKDLQLENNLEQVLFINSIYGLVAVNTELNSNPAKLAPPQYGVAKAAQLHLVKEMAVRLAHQSVRVNAIAFGGVDGVASESFKSAYSKLSPQGRMLSPEDVESSVLMALDPTLKSVTGHTFVVDGGWTLW